MPENALPLDVSHLRTTLDHLNMGVYITDRDRRILLWNRKAEEITGWRASEVVGKSCRDDILVHVDRNGQLLCSTQLCPLYRAMELNKESREPILVFARKADGTRVAVSVTVAPLRDEKGTVVGGIETFRDESAQVRDLEFARTVQQRLTPESLPQEGVVRFAVRHYPHDLVSGDFYDVLPAGTGRYGVLIADVRGHGVGAGLYTMMLKSLEEQMHPHAPEPARFMAAVNVELSRYVVDESFATAFYAVVDLASGSLRYTNAGHPAPMHFHRADGAVTEMETHGLPLGIAGDGGYAEGSVQLAPGDLLLCYTDGIVEANDHAGKMLGTPWLAAALQRYAPRTPVAMLEHIYRDALSACGDVILPDDVLLLSIARPA